MASDKASATGYEYVHEIPPRLRIIMHGREGAFSSTTLRDEPKTLALPFSPARIRTKSSLRPSDQWPAVPARSS